MSRMRERRLSTHGSRGIAVILQLAASLRCGRLAVVLPDGSRRQFRGELPGPEATLILRTGRVARRYLASGAVGFAEGYIEGDWDSPDLATLLELLDRNAEAWQATYYSRGWQRWALRLVHALRANSRRGSRRNIHAHYDLGNAFFAAWLDPSMTYSSALFEAPEADLETAQLAKYRKLATLIGLKPGQRLLEIGTGWGGFAITAAKEFGARVTGITISKEQHDFARRRVFEEGLAEQVDIRLADYRDIEGRFERIASIEMFEAVGEPFWPLFFRRLRDRLTPDGQAGLQLITIDDRHFDAYRRSVDFIQRYIFPGGMLPSLSALERVTREAGLRNLGTSAFGQSYARTLNEWNHRFQAAWPRLVEHGFDERFRRIWTFYLAYCEAAFRTGSTNVLQLALHPG